MASNDEEKKKRKEGGRGVENNGSGRERMIRARRLATCNSYAGERFRNPCEAGETRPLGPIFARWFEGGMQNASPPLPRCRYESTNRG